MKGSCLNGVVLVVVVIVMEAFLFDLSDAFSAVVGIFPSMHGGFFAFYHHCAEVDASLTWMDEN